MPRTRVPYDVGEGLLDDAERGQVGTGRQPRRLAFDLDGETGARRLLDQFGKPVQPGGRRAGRVSGGAERAYANELRKKTGNTSSAHSETATVTPLKTTVRPAARVAPTTASGWACPAARSSRRNAEVS